MSTAPRPSVSDFASTSSAKKVRVAHLDHSNIVIAGSQVSAARRGMCVTPQAAAGSGVFDLTFRLHFGNLFHLALGSPEPGVDLRAVAFGSFRPDDDNRWIGAAEWAGWQPRMRKRALSGKEKQVDTGLGITLLEDAMRYGMGSESLELTLLSGDSDHVPAVEAVLRIGGKVDVMSWEHALSRELASLARRVVLLDDHFEYLRYTPTRR
jgi:hypothetical protein